MAKKILVVDDDPEIVEFTKKRLESRGYSVITAFDGDEGIKKVNEDKPDLIILDMMMPKRDGLSMFYHVKKDEATRLIPIIMLTAKGETSAIFDAQSYGASEYFIKPCNWDKLLECVRRYVGSS